MSKGSARRVEDRNKIRSNWDLIFKKEVTKMESEEQKKMTARKAFEALYNQFQLSDSDAAWIVFKNGWDAALDEAANQFEQMPFGDTSASFSAYAKGLKND